MKKSQATEGVLGGHALSRRALLQSHGSPQMHAVLELCAVAAASERPGLEAADAALAAAVTELAEVVPDAHACNKKGGVAFSKKSARPVKARWMLDAPTPLGWRAVLGLIIRAEISGRKVYEQNLSQCFWAIGRVS